jgi:hypothetical protein
MTERLGCFHLRLINNKINMAFNQDKHFTKTLHFNCPLFIVMLRMKIKMGISKVWLKAD